MTAAALDGNLLPLLNDDCIYKILERLSLDDLCLFSRTCKRFQKLCENHFHRKYQNEAAKNVEIIINMNNGKIRLRNNQKYVRYFYSFITNLTISGWYSMKQNKELTLSSVVNFVKAKCDLNLHTICIDGGLELVLLSDEIKSFLSNVEVVQFKDREERGQQEALFLKRCPNLKKLILNNEMPDENVDKILEHKYDQLTQFYYLHGNGKNLNVAKLKTFFHMNEQIQYVAWKFNFADGDHALECIKTVHNVVKLKSFFLSIGAPLSNHFDDLCGFLKVLCERETFTTVEMEYFGRQTVGALQMHGDKVANLKQLTKIHLSFLRLSDMIQPLLSMVHLKIIVMDSLYPEYNLSDWSNIDDLISVVESTNNMVLPQVEEVHFGDIENAKELLTFIMLLVRHWMNLKKILVPRRNDFNTKFDIVELNRARIKLENACKLTVFTNHNDNKTVDLELVKLKFVQFEPYSDLLFERCTIASGQ